VESVVELLPIGNLPWAQKWERGGYTRAALHRPNRERGVFKTTRMK
jgi:hypothetical protein